MRRSDGSAGDADYGEIGRGYASYRSPEPSIAARIHEALGDATTVLNVGAGAGSYEPIDRRVTAVEPSASMREQRPKELSIAIDAVVENLPFPDAHFDASMTTFSIHQWSDIGTGLREMRRVTRGPVVILTCDPDLVQQFWLNEYAPQVLAAEARRYPQTKVIADILGPSTKAQIVPIPLNCRDGFNEAYYGRPEMFLQSDARLACSAWSFVDRETTSAYVKRLEEDLATGRWDARFGNLRSEAEYTGSLILAVSGH